MKDSLKRVPKKPLTLRLISLAISFNNFDDVIRKDHLQLYQRLVGRVLAYQSIRNQRSRNHLIFLAKCQN